MRSSAAPRTTPSARRLDPVALALAVQAKRLAAVKPVEPSAYARAQQLGFAGSETEWTAFLAGERFNQRVLAQIVGEQVDRGLAQRPLPKNGKDADPVETLRLVRDAVAQIPRPQDGASVTLDDVRPLIAQAVSRAAKLLPEPQDAEPGPMGPMPRHQWDGTRLRFEMPGGWGLWVDLQGEPGKPGVARRGQIVLGGGLSREEVLALIEEHGMGQYDDYAEIEYLQDQIGNGGVREFIFSSAVQFIVIELVSTLDEATEADAIDAIEGRVTTGATQPATDLGAVLKHEVPVTLLVGTDTVNVLAPADTRITVYGKRRPAS